jgi:hypothetical protein
LWRRQVQNGLLLSYNLQFSSSEGKTIFLSSSFLSLLQKGKLSFDRTGSERNVPYVTCNTPVSYDRARGGSRAGAADGRAPGRERSFAWAGAAACARRIRDPPRLHSSSSRRGGRRRGRRCRCVCSAMVGFDVLIAAGSDRAALHPSIEQLHLSNCYRY